MADVRTNENIAVVLIDLSKPSGETKGDLARDESTIRCADMHDTAGAPSS